MLHKLILTYTLWMEHCVDDVHDCLMIVIVYAIIKKSVVSIFILKALRQLFLCRGRT